MGSQVEAICQCGLKKKILIGGNRANFRYTQYFPCICINCNDIVQANLKAETLECPHCNSTDVIPYISRELIGKKGKKVVAQSFDDILTDGNYKCPKCKEMTLHFTAGHLEWD